MITKQDIENAAASLFISDSGEEVPYVALVRANGECFERREWAEVVTILCLHLGIKL